jgi:two-component system chemotaxis sensor kinase CheA
MNAPAEMDDLLQDFLAEAREMLEDVDAKLIELEHCPDDHELLNTVFRGFHTIKGGAGFLDATSLVEVCHRAESLLDQLRSGERRLTPEMLDVILAATAAVHDMFNELAAHGSPGPADPALIAALESTLHGDDVAPAAAPAPQLVAFSPSPDGIDWSAYYAGLTGVAAPPAAPVEERRVGDRRMAERRSDQPARAPKGVEPKESALRIDTSRFDQIINLSGEIGLVKNRIVCLRGEILSSEQRHAEQNAVTLRNFDAVVGQLETLVGYLQNSVMKARMQTVGRVFQKYSRMTRDLARQLGKDVELVITGEETEIDKTMLDELNDPLVHLVRNAVDHGVDTPAERAAAGKPAKSIVQLNARQSGDQIIIEIIDDGRGMRPEAIRQKAIEKGAISAEEAATLDDKQSLHLIFLPGFSTKDDISDVSGRGVGMDVVRTNIQKLNGRIELHSEPGRGTRVAIVLPLTLAILPVLMFTVRGQQYAVPLSVVREIVPLAPEHIQSVSGRPSMVVRGEVLPILALNTLLVPPHGAPPASNEVGVIVNFAEQMLILAVDAFDGQDEVVIKPLEGFKPVGVAGATLSREGLLVLVLDLSELLQLGLARAA